jgi:hypothetical protein
MARCATVGCGEAAAVTVSYRFREPEGLGVVRREDVCRDCGEGYSRRAMLAEVTLSPLGTLVPVIGHITVAVRSVYGKDLVYPAGPVAAAFARLAGKKTFDGRDLAAIRELGFEIHGL